MIPSPLRHLPFATLFLAAPVLAQAAGFSAQRVITTSTDRAQDVFAIDLDGDGDADVLTASSIDDKIAWIENEGAGSFGTPRVITTAADGANSVFAIDLDADGDADVLSASGTDDKIAWYENLGEGSFGPQSVISTNAASAQAVYATDLDQDGDPDVLSASLSDDKIAWYENLGGGTFGAEQILTTNARAATDVFAIDLDGDNDADVLSSSFLDDKLAWYENLGSGSFGPQQIISTDSIFFTSVYATDFDGDGDADVLSASRDDAEIAWYENLGNGNFGSQQVISIEVAGARSAYAADLDGDGDDDVVAIGSSAFNQVAWFENQGSGSFGPMQAIEPQNSPLIVFGNSVFAADVNGDGNPDVLTASSGDNKISWYANELFGECEPSLGAQGPGTLTATLCGVGLNFGETSDYRITGAQPNAAGAFLISLANGSDVTLFPGTSNPGTLVSGVNIIAAVPLAAGSTGDLTISILGSSTTVDLVVQSLLVDATVPEHNVAFSNALLARFGQ